ncbi:MAG: hypothetical protein V3T54_06835 [Acidobacteriota bacterium]
MIRPNISDVKQRAAGFKQRAASSQPSIRRKPTSHDQTNAESFYYLKQMGNKTPMVVLLCTGEELHGVLEWYDHNSVKVNRKGAPNLLVMKHGIKYMYKAEERNGGKGMRDGNRSQRS